MNISVCIFLATKPSFKVIWFCHVGINFSILSVHVLVKSAYRGQRHRCSGIILIITDLNPCCNSTKVPYTHQSWFWNNWNRLILTFWNGPDNNPIDIWCSMLKKKPDLCQERNQCTWNQKSGQICVRNFWNGYKESLANKQPKMNDVHAYDEWMYISYLHCSFPVWLWWGDLSLHLKSLTPVFQLILRCRVAAQ